MHTVVSWGDGWMLCNFAIELEIDLPNTATGLCASNSVIERASVDHLA